MKHNNAENKIFREYFKQVITTPIQKPEPWTIHEKSYYEHVIRRPASQPVVLQV